MSRRDAGVLVARALSILFLFGACQAALSILVYLAFSWSSAWSREGISWMETQSSKLIVQFLFAAMLWRGAQQFGSVSDEPLTGPQIDHRGAIRVACAGVALYFVLNSLDGLLRYVFAAFEGTWEAGYWKSLPYSLVPVIVATCFIVWGFSGRSVSRLISFPRGEPNEEDSGTP